MEKIINLADRRLMKLVGEELEEARFQAELGLHLMLKADIMRMAPRARSAFIKRFAAMKRCSAWLRPEVLEAAKNRCLLLGRALTLEETVDLLSVMAPEALEVRLT